MILILILIFLTIYTSSDIKNLNTSYETYLEERHIEHISKYNKLQNILNICKSKYNAEVFILYPHTFGSKFCYSMLTLEDSIRYQDQDIFGTLIDYTLEHHLHNAVCWKHSNYIIGIFEGNIEKLEIIKSFIEYNLDTSAEHPEMDDDIVRYSSEKRRV